MFGQMQCLLKERKVMPKKWWKYQCIAIFFGIVSISWAIYAPHDIKLFALLFTFIGIGFEFIAIPHTFDKE